MDITSMIISAVLAPIHLVKFLLTPEMQMFSVVAIATFTLTVILLSDYMRGKNFNLPMVAGMLTCILIILIGMAATNNLSALSIQSIINYAVWVVVCVPLLWRSDKKFFDEQLAIVQPFEIWSSDGKTYTQEEKRKIALKRAGLYHEEFPTIFSIGGVLRICNYTVTLPVHLCARAIKLLCRKIESLPLEESGV